MNASTRWAGPGAKRCYSYRPLGWLVRNTRTAIQSAIRFSLEYFIYWPSWSLFKADLLFNFLDSFVKLCFKASNKQVVRILQPQIFIS